MLSGLVADADGERLTATPTLKGKRRYRYYAGQALRIPAEELETLVCDALHEHLASPAKLATLLPDLSLLSTAPIAGAAEVAVLLGSAEARQRRTLAEGLIAAVTISRSAVTLDLVPERLGGGSGTGKLVIPASIGTARARLTLVVPGGARTVVNPGLVAVVAPAREWFAALAQGDRRTLGEIARAEDVSKAHVRQLIGAAFLAPDGGLSPAECVAIDDIFWLSKSQSDPWSERDALLATPGLAKSALRRAISSARVLCCGSDPDQSDPDRNLVCRAVELTLQTVLAADTNAQPEVDRLTEIVQALRQTVTDEAADRAERERAAAPVPAPAIPVSPNPAAASGDTVASIFAELDRLVGLDRVKHEVGTLVNLAKVFALRRTMGIPVPDMSFHLVFLGNSGTGKTTVARIVARLYGALGLLSKGQLVEVDRSGLVGNDIGQTATKTQGVLSSAFGGVLFIDEAYALDGGSEGGYGEEAVATLLKGMEDHRRDLVVIAAGYTDEMHRFLDMNPGLRSRLSRDIVLDDYAPADMLAIFRGMASEAHFELADACDSLLLPLLQQLWGARGKDFANARDVRNLFERVVEAQANRVGGLPSPTRADVCAITTADLGAIAGPSPA